MFNGYIQCGVSPAPTGCYKNKLMNPAPRIGFAFDPKGDGKMAIRGGYGIFFEHSNGNEANAESLQQGASPLVLISQQSNVPGYDSIGGSGGGLFFPINPWSIPNQVQWPYMMQWNLSIQKELPYNIVASVAYVGSKGTHLTNQLDLNQLYPINQATNPFKPGQAIADDGSDCNFGFVGSSNGLPTSASPWVTEPRFPPQPSRTCGQRAKTMPTPTGPIMATAPSTDWKMVPIRCTTRCKLLLSGLSGS